MKMFLTRLSATAIRGIALVLLWRWFVATPFGVIPLTLFHALGLSVMVQLFTFHLTWADIEANDGKDEKNLFLCCLASLTALLLGFVVSFFM